MSTKNKPLVIAGCLSFFASSLHIGCIVGGGDWYRFFGAGEAFAQLAESGSYVPAVITFVIAVILAIWGLYALSGAGILPHLPLLRTLLILITSVYLLRGLIGLLAPFLSNATIIQQNSTAFWIISSLVCCIYGLFYLFGTWQLLRR